MIRRIDKAAVIGSGIMGGGIAALLADAGVETMLFDIVPFNLSEEEKKDKSARYRIVQAGFDAMMKARPALIMDPKSAKRISVCNLEDDLKKLGECDLIVEVVVENLKIKQELFAKIDKVRKADTIITTNTSGLPLKEISKGLSKQFKQHFMGTHFFNPVRYMHLLELIPSGDTKKEILDFMAEFGEKKLGKGIVWAKDTTTAATRRTTTPGAATILRRWRTGCGTRATPLPASPDHPSRMLSRSVSLNSRGTCDV